MRYEKFEGMSSGGAGGAGANLGDHELPRAKTERIINRLVFIELIIVLFIVE